MRPVLGGEPRLHARHAVTNLHSGGAAQTLHRTLLDGYQRERTLGERQYDGYRLAARALLNQYQFTASEIDTGAPDGRDARESGVHPHVARCTRQCFESAASRVHVRRSRWVLRRRSRWSPVFLEVPYRRAVFAALRFLRLGACLKAGSYAAPPSAPRPLRYGVQELDE